MTGIVVTLEGLAAALTLGTVVAALAPRLASRYVPSLCGSWSQPQRLITGAATAAAGGLLIWRLPLHEPSACAVLAAWLTFTAAGIVLSIIDIAVHRLPTPIIVGTSAAVGMLLVIGAVLDGHPGTLVEPALAAAAIGGGYLLLAATGASNIGMGDVRLATLTGLILGTHGWPSVILGAAAAYLLAVPFATAALLRRPSGSRPVQLPFGPFLVAGTLAAGIAAVTFTT